MLRLLHASCYRYASSPLTKAAAVTSLLLGIVLGCRKIIFPIPAVICAVVIVLTAGREFSDRTIRNKLTCGATKAQVFLSECIAGAAVMTVCCLLFSMPLILLIRNELAQLPEGTPVLLFAILYLVSVSAAFISVTCCFLAANRTYGALITGGVLFLAVLSGSLIKRRLFISRDEYSITYETVYAYDEDGNGTVEAVSNKERNEFYLPESTQKYIRLAGNLHPGYALLEAASYYSYRNDTLMEAMSANADDPSWDDYWEKHNSDKNADTEMLPFIIMEQCVFLVLIAGCGMLIFRKKNLV